MNTTSTSMIGVLGGMSWESTALYYRLANELVRLGASVRIDGHHAVVRGRERLSSAPVVATDIRAGAGLVLAGLLSDGVTEVQDVRHIDRGYPDFVEQLRGLGVRIDRTERPD